MGIFDATIVKIAAIFGKSSAGQQTMADSIPVVLPSNQTAIPVTDNSSSLTVDNADITALLATLGATGDAATAGAGTVNAHERFIAASWDNYLTNKFPASLGQGTMAQGLRVVTGSNQQAGYNSLDVSSSNLGNAEGLTAKLANPLATTDYDIRDTNEHWIFIPMSGWRDISLGVYSNNYDVAMQCSVYVAHNNDTAHKYGLVATFQLANATSFFIGNGAVGQGGTAGGATQADAVMYNVPALASRPKWVALMFQRVTGAAPTAGILEVSIQRTA